MGSGQSHPSASGATETEKSSYPSSNSETLESVSSPSSQDVPPPNTMKANAKPKPPPKNESGYDRAQRVCRKKKLFYDACYTAQLSSKEEDCSDLFESYRTCFLRVITKDMDKRGVKVSENSMIGEYKEDIADEDDNS